MKYSNLAISASFLASLFHVDAFSQTKTRTQRIMEKAPVEGQAGGAGASTTWDAFVRTEQNWRRTERIYDRKQHVRISAMTCKFIIHAPIFSKRITGAVDRSKILSKLPWRTVAAVPVCLQKKKMSKVRQSHDLSEVVPRHYVTSGQNVQLVYSQITGLAWMTVHAPAVHSS